MSIYTPYTYLIGWSSHNKYYYGCEYGQISKTAHPDNLWKTYFTSSKTVHMLADQYGDPDIIQIRKTFNNADQCIKWEQKVLSRMGVLHRDDFLNANIAGATIPTKDIINARRQTLLKQTPERKAAIAELRRKRYYEVRSTWSDEKKAAIRKKQSLQKKGKKRKTPSVRGKDHWSYGKKRVFSEQHLANLREERKNRVYSDEQRKKMSEAAKKRAAIGRTWWHTTTKETLSAEQPGEGWVKGRLKKKPSYK